MLFQIKDSKHIVTNQHEELLVEKRKVTQLQDQLKDVCIDTHLIDNEEIEKPMPELLPAENQNIHDNFQQVVNPQIPAAETSDEITMDNL